MLGTNLTQIMDVLKVFGAEQMLKIDFMYFLADIAPDYVEAGERAKFCDRMAKNVSGKPFDEQLK